MNLFKPLRKPSSFSRLAYSSWTPTKQEKNALDKHSYISKLHRVDQIWDSLADSHGLTIAVDAPHAAHPEKFNYLELSQRISAASSSFISLGIVPGDVVAIFAENSPRWLVADQGLMKAGAADAVRGASAPIEELKYILNDSGAKGLIVQNSLLWKKLSLEKDFINKFLFIIQLEGEPCEGVLAWEDFLSVAIGAKNLPLKGNGNQNYVDNSIATILYTSGTTGEPKGVPLTHSNLLHQIQSLCCIADPDPGTSVLSVLPIWHAYERSAEYYFFSCACTQTYTSIKHLKQDLPRVKPVVMATVPRLWEAIQVGFEDALKDMPSPRQNVIKFAISNSYLFKLSLRRSRNLLLSQVGILTRVCSFFEVIIRTPIHLFSSYFLWPKILRILCGGQLKYPINGGGAIAPHVDSFFEALGVELLVGYGLTETSPVLSCRRTWRNIRGSSGLPLPETELKIIDPETLRPKLLNEKGLVLARGKQIMHGYLNKNEATQKVLDKDGWFNTGDLGMLLNDGSLVITGRLKDTVVLSSGENIEPGPLEEYLLASSLFDQVMIVGQDKKQLALLVVPNFDEMFNWARDKGLYIPENLGGIPGDQKLRNLIRLEVNGLLSRRAGSRNEERVCGVVLVDRFSIENGLLTQTLKQRRDKISIRDKDLIALIYQA